MTSKLKCPFCGEELVRHWGMKDPAIYCCDNLNCKRGGVGTEQSWQALIQSQKDLAESQQATLQNAQTILEIHKDLEIARKALEDVKNDALTKNRYHIIADANHALEQIEHKE